MWLVFSLFTALFYSLEGVWIKKITKKINYFTATWALFAFAVPYVIIPFALTGIPEIKGVFYYSLLGSLCINMAAFTLFSYAVKISPLSMTYPFLALTPVFLILSGYVFLGEMPGIYGIAGILLIVSGSYCLNIEEMNKGFLGPFYAIKKEKGALIMILVAFLWSIASSLDKIAVLASNPFFYVFSINTCFCVFYLPFLMKINPKFFSEIREYKIDLAILGFFAGGMTLFQMLAVELTLISYTIAIKRAGMLFAMIFGLMFFNERLRVGRSIGTILIITGVLLIGIAGR